MNLVCEVNKVALKSNLAGTFLSPFYSCPICEKIGGSKQDQKKGKAKL